MEVSEGAGDMCRTKLGGFERRASVQRRCGKMATQMRNRRHRVPTALHTHSQTCVIMHAFILSCIHAFIHSGLPQEEAETS